MPRLADGFVNELKGRIDLYDVISPYVQLKKSGASWVGLSPFSQEKSPSFYVHPDKGFFKCFSSGEGGDAISFVQKIENLEFPEALELLAQRFQIPLRYAEDSGSSGKPTVSRSLRADLYELHKYTTDWFHQRLLDENEDAASVRKYWIEERGFSMETANEFGIGYAPTDPYALSKFLSAKKFSTSTLLKSGLFRDGKGKGIGPGVFCGRLMIPISDKIGRICAFTARKLSQTPEWGDRKSPKYVNSPETPIFEKGNLLFNLHLANKEISEDKEFIMVEGQLDAIRCWTMGFRTVVAAQGTAFKDSQALLLSRSRPKGVVCLLDGDTAGQKAALSYVSIFLKAGMEARFAELPEGSDPDQILIKGGTEAMQQVIDDARSMVEHVVRQKIPDLKTATPKQKESVCQWMFGSLIEVDSRVALEGYLEQLARLLAVPMDALKSDFVKFRKNRTPAYRQSTKDKELPSNTPDRLTIVEEDLLFVLLHDDRLASPLAHTLDMSWVDLRPISGRILAKILSETLAESSCPSRAQIEELLEDDEERDLFYRLVIQEIDQSEPGLLLRLARQCVSVLFLRHLKLQEDNIFTQLKNAEDNPQKLKQLSQELRAIRQKKTNPPPLEFYN
ncbi:DNA primase [Opitutales bacterium]|nr:DNA primase [Opitutales bacterium]